MGKLYFFIGILFLLAGNSIFAQYDTKLRNKLHNELAIAKTDTAKIRIMAALGDYYVEESYLLHYKKSMDTAFHYAKKLTDFSNSIHSDKGQSEANLLYGKAYGMMSNHLKAREYVQKAININTKSGNKQDLVRSYRMLLMENRYLEDNDANIKLGEKIVKLAKESGNALETAKSLELLADFYDAGMDLPKTLHVLEESLKYYKLAGEGRVQNAYAFMATIYGTLGEQQKSYESIVKSIAIVEKYNDKTYYTSTIYRLAGKTYLEMERYDEAEKYFKKAYQITKRFGDAVFEVVTARSLIHVLSLRKKDKEILPYLEEIESKYKSIRSPYKEFGIAVLLERYVVMKDFAKAQKYYNELKEALPKIADNAVALQQGYDSMSRYEFAIKMYDLARENLMKSKAMSEKSKAKFKLKRAYEMLFKIDSAQGHYLAAIEHQNKANLYKDSLYNEVKNKQLTQMQVQYDVEKKDKDNQLLKQEASLREAKLSRATIIRNSSFIGILLLVIALALIYRRFKINQRIKKEIDIKNQALTHLLDEKEWLLKEIHHRVKNNLQIVMSLLNTQSHFLNDDSAREAIKNSQDRIHSISLIHKKLYQTENVVAVNMQLYIMELTEYFKASFDTKQRLRFILDVEAIELDSSRAVPVGLILNEAVSNAIKHAFPENKEGLIDIKLYRSATNNIILSIKDNGVGAEEDLNDNDFSSLGIKLIKGFSTELKAKLKFVNHNGLQVSLEFPDTAMHVANLPEQGEKAKVA